MGQELWKVQDHLTRMEELARGVLNHAAAIKKIRAEHPHTFAFNYQVNAHHVRLWHVVYHCSGCGELKTEKKEPVCSRCNTDTTLTRCDASDTEAEKERVQPEHQGYDNSPIAFRCPACKKIHILRYQGD